MEFDFLFADGQIPVLQLLRHGVKSTVEIEVDERAFAVLQLVERGRLLDRVRCFWLHADEARGHVSAVEYPVHHASKQRPATDASFKAEQEKRRREEAIAQTTGLRVLKATSDAVPVRLMKRDLLFVTERLAAVLDERRLAIIFRLHGIGKASGGAGDAPVKLLASFLRKADESTLGRVLVAITVLQTAHSSNESSKALREAAEFYKVDVAAITAKVRQEFAAKEKAQATRKEAGKAKPAQPRTEAKKAKAA